MGKVSKVEWKKTLDDLDTVFETRTINGKKYLNLIVGHVGVKNDRNNKYRTSLMKDFFGKPPKVYENT